MSIILTAFDSLHVNILKRLGDIYWTYSHAVLLYDHAFLECFDVFGAEYCKRYPEESNEIMQYVQTNETDYLMDALIDKDGFMQEMQSELLHVMFQQQISFVNYQDKLFNKSVVSVW